MSLFNDVDEANLSRLVTSKTGKSDLDMKANTHTRHMLEGKYCYAQGH